MYEDEGVSISMVQPRFWNKLQRREFPMEIDSQDKDEDEDEDEDEVNVKEERGLSGFGS